MSNAPTATDRRLSRAAWCALALLLGLLAWQCRNGWPVTSDLMTLAPDTGTSRALEQPRRAWMRHWLSK